MRRSGSILTYGRTGSAPLVAGTTTCGPRSAASWPRTSARTGTASCHPPSPPTRFGIGRRVGTPRDGGRPPQKRGPITSVEDAPACDTGGFTPRARDRAPLAAHTRSPSPDPSYRQRLRELPMIYILMLGIAIFWRKTVLGGADLTLNRYDAVIMMVLVGIIAALSIPWRIPLAWLKALELGILGLLAFRITFVQYRLMLFYSLREDPMMAQLTMKNVVLLTSILILTYGLYVPKSWRRAALIAGPLALLPFATLLVLYLQYPEAMTWLGQGWRRNPNTPRILLLVFDALILLMLAAGSTFGARAMSRLRREVAEARQLGQYCLRRQLGAGGMGEVYLAEHKFLKRPAL